MGRELQVRHRHGRRILGINLRYRFALNPRYQTEAAPTDHCHAALRKQSANPSVIHRRRARLACGSRPVTDSHEGRNDGLV